jgi:hypothetical protein
VYFNKSPTVVFDTYREYSGDIGKPCWLDLQAPLVFRQPRAQMVELLAFLAKDDCNKVVSADVLDWCHSLTVSILEPTIRKHYESMYIDSFFYARDPPGFLVTLNAPDQPEHNDITCSDRFLPHNQS